MKRQSMECQLHNVWGEVIDKVLTEVDFHTSPGVSAMTRGIKHAADSIMPDQDLDDELEEESRK